MSPAVSILWALVPLFTLGLGTMFVLGWAARRLRSRWLAVCAAAALIVTIGVFAISPGSAASGALIVLGLMGGGLAATFTVRSRLVKPALPGPSASTAAAGWIMPPSPAAASANRPAWHGGVDPAVQEALAHRQRRAEARRLLETDPALARELRIGRPDLPRRFDDGGLVDVNHVPASVLANLPGFTPQLAARVAQARDQCGGFTLPQEMEAYSDLPEGLSDELAERLIFVR